MHLVSKGGLASVLAIAMLANSWSPSLATASTIVLRDSIGPDNAMTNGQRGLITSGSFENPVRAPVTVTSGVEAVLTTVQIVGFFDPSNGDDFPSVWPDPAGSFGIDVWNNINDAAAHVNDDGGTVPNGVMVIPPAQANPIAWGVSGNFLPLPFEEHARTWLITLDISSAHIPISAGQSLTIGVNYLENQFLDYHFMLSGSSEIGQSSDIRLRGYPPDNQFLASSISGLPSGRFAYRVLAEAVPEPSTFALGILGTLSLAAFGRRLRHQRLVG